MGKIFSTDTKWKKVERNKDWIQFRFGLSFYSQKFLFLNWFCGVCRKERFWGGESIYLSLMMSNEADKEVVRLYHFQLEINLYKKPCTFRNSTLTRTTVWVSKYGFITFLLLVPHFLTTFYSLSQIFNTFLAKKLTKFVLCSDQK